MLVPWLVAPATTLRFYLFLVVLMSPVCFALYGIDKRRATRQQVRISERTLHLAAFVGGWPGAWLGQRVFRHKTEKFLFRMVFWSIVGAHLCFLGLLLTGVLLR
jgi:uncharacterized membrane protein YsdA (DUF1294 family)